MSALQAWAIAPVLLPLVAGIVLLLTRSLGLAWQRVLGLGSVLALLVPVGVLLGAVGEGTIAVHALGNWPPPFGIVLVADRLAAWMLAINVLVALFALLYAVQGSDAQGRHFHVLFQLQLFGLNGAFLTGDLFNLFVFFEILLLASFGLLLHGGGKRITRAGLHFVVINLTGSALFLVAVGTLYGVLGTLNMADLAVRAGEAPAGELSLVRTAGLLLFVVFALKAALLPLHLWLPAAYANTTAAVAALFAIMTKVGAYGILRMESLVFGGSEGPLAALYQPWLLPLALLTLAAGAVGVLASRGLRRQGAYLVLVSVGTVLVAFGLGSRDGVAAGLYYLPHSVFASAAFFLLADIVARARGPVGDRIQAGPALPRAALLGWLFFLAALLIAGMPPFAGYLGKFLVLQAAVEHAWMGPVLAVMLVGVLLTVAALARSGSQVFHAAGEGGGMAPEAERPGAGRLLPALALMGLCLLLTVAAGPAHEFSLAAADQLADRGDYIQAVLGHGGGR